MKNEEFNNRAQRRGKMTNDEFSNYQLQGKRPMAGSFNCFSTALWLAKLLRLVFDTAALRGRHRSRAQGLVTPQGARWAGRRSRSAARFTKRSGRVAVF